MLAYSKKSLFAAFLVILGLELVLSAAAQQSGNVEGVVKDPSGAVVPGQCTV